MCTVIIRVPEPRDAASGMPTRLIAIRDEDPSRSWDPLGESWPEEYPGVIGVRDHRAGGAWLAADPDERRLAVLLNRKDESPLAPDEFLSRGGVVLESVAGRPPADDPRTHGFNLLEVSPDGSRVSTWDGVHTRHTDLAPGVHMLAHDDVDDPGTPRISAWLDEFRATPLATGIAWWMPWLHIIARSADLPADDDRTIIRDNRPFGYPTLSTLLCAASVDESGVTVRYGELDEPGHWGPVVALT